MIYSGLLTFINYFCTAITLLKILLAGCPNLASE